MNLPYNKNPCLLYIFSITYSIDYALNFPYGEIQNFWHPQQGIESKYKPKNTGSYQNSRYKSDVVRIISNVEEIIVKKFSRDDDTIFRALRIPIPISKAGECFITM